MPQYRKGFVRLMREVEELFYLDLGWTDAEMTLLIAGLYYAHAANGLRRCFNLNLVNNPLGDTTYNALTQLLGTDALPNLEKVRLYHSRKLHNIDPAAGPSSAATARLEAAAAARGVACYTQKNHQEDPWWQKNSKPDRAGHVWVT